MNKNIKKASVVFRNTEKGRELGDQLNHLGYASDTAFSGLTALKMMKSRCPYDLLITELLLDEVSGLALCSVAKQNSNTRVVAVNNGDRTLRVVADEFGVDLVVKMPKVPQKGYSTLLLTKQAKLCL
jgi:DNA-binding response OmpR family regulator